MPVVSLTNKRSDTDQLTYFGLLEVRFTRFICIAWFLRLEVNASSGSWRILDNSTHNRHKLFLVHYSIKPHCSLKLVPSAYTQLCHFVHHAKKKHLQVLTYMQPVVMLQYTAQDSNSQVSKLISYTKKAVKSSFSLECTTCRVDHVT